MRSLICLLCLGLVPLSGLAADGSPPAADDGAALIAEFGLRESDRPVSEHPRWRRPQTIVVDSGIPGLFEALDGSAPGVRFVAANSATQMAAAVAAGADAVIGRTPLICDPRVLGAGPSLRWVQTVYAGVDRCLPSAERFQQGLLLTNMRAIGSSVIAEHALGLTFALARGLQVSIANQTRATWDESLGGASLIALRGKTLLVVGLGGIGTEVAQRAHALGMRVLATRASDRPAPDYVARVGKPEDLPALLGEADVVVNAVPLTPATRNLFDARLFERMKRSALFINVGRGGTVVTDDLVAALESRSIGGAGLDVTEPEPLPRDHPLWRAPNVIITPHMAGSSDLGVEAQLRVLRVNIQRYVSGGKLLSVVDMGRAY
ncbi:MAG: D-2-hydroxyacid dehydrogenase [Steroidobacteraceae bacterium]